MLNSEKIRQGLVAAVASIILTVTVVGAAVGPAYAVRATSVAAPRA